MIREMRRSEIPLFYKWLVANRDTCQMPNWEDFEPFRNEQCKIYVSVNENDEPQCFYPVRVVWEFYGLAPNPELSASEKAKLFQSVPQFIANDARKNNVGVLRLQPSDSKFSAFLKRLGFKNDTREQLTMNTDKVKEQSNNA